MSELSRRSMLGGALTLTACCIGWPLSAQSYGKRRFKLPQGAMILSRRIERPLSDGAMIVVTRSWEVLFAPSGQGITVEGHQLEADVEAPAKLAALAQLEKDRRTDDMFPILLSSDGKVLRAGTPDNRADLQKAADLAAEIIERSSRTTQEKKALISYLPALQAAGGTLMDALPPGLFFPAAGEQREIRKLNLPDGLVGEIELLSTAQNAPGEQWLGRIERRIVTRVGGTSQESRELWTMYRA